ncbi:MAG: EcsC family protein [Verrucomicrobia bacterium]|nr:EcsC family protein [Verrucomicrobiota bacterium]
MSPDELRQLAHARALLEHPSLAIRLASLVGKPIEQGMRRLPHGWQATVHRVSRTALTKALEVAMGSLGTNSPRRASEWFHKVLVAASGGVGGAFGLASLPFELPVSTILMLRSIADIARSEGHNVLHPSVKVACMEVFALGGASPEDDAAESGYWAVRAALSKALSEAAACMTQRRVLQKAAPAVVRLMAAIASRFGTAVSEQVAAKAVPVVGAAGGAMINVLFMNHFQDMARGHFIVKRLEWKYGWDAVRHAYHGAPEPPALDAG